MIISFSIEKANKIIILALIACLVGLLLVVQPSCIFGQAGLNIIGVGFICGSGLARASTTAFVKYTSSIDLSHTTVVVPQFIVSFLLLILYMYGVLVLEWHPS